ncbi:MAG: hypothetical protein ACOWWR_03165 [Eubacteriales bacterium]
MAKETPIWAEKRLQKLLETDEKIFLELKGRVEQHPSTGIGALFFWISYFFTNIVGFVVTLLVRKTAWLVVTDKRFIILTNDGSNWPFWVVPFSRSNIDYTIERKNIASVHVSDNFAFWFIRARGLRIESIGSLDIVFNGMSVEGIEKAKSFLATQSVK